MGNALVEPKKKALTIHDLEVKVGEYKTIQEGDPEMKEDPEFPLHMMHDAMDNNNTIEGNAVQGTYVYYPNKNKPKMWIGNYKILNPEDILCKDVAEKIGMSEAQWRKYIEEKKNGKPISGEYADFDFLPEDQKETLNNAIKNGLFEYPFDQNNNEKPINGLGFNENMQKYLNLYKNNTPNSNEINEEETFYQNVIDTEETEFVTPIKDAYEEYTEDIKDIKDYNSYIEKLNAESSRIRHAQEQDIFKQQKKILYYSNMNLGHGTVITVESNPLMFQKDMIPYEFLHEKETGSSEEIDEENVGEPNELANVGANSSPESIKKKDANILEKKQMAKMALYEIEKKITHQKKEKEKEEVVKAKVNSFRKKTNSNYKVELVTNKNRSKYSKTLASMSTKSSITMNKPKVVTTDRSKFLKNTTLRRN